MFCEPARLHDAAEFAAIVPLRGADWCWLAPHLARTRRRPLPAHEELKCLSVCAGAE